MNLNEDLSVSLETQIRYPLYYRRSGVRMPMQLMMPVLSDLAELSLPLNSLLHYIPDDESVYGIPQDDQILRDVERMIMVEHVEKLADNRGNPIPIKIPAGQMTRAYHKKYRKTRPLLNFEAVNGNPRTLIVENYALLPHLSRYLNNYFRPYSKWWNIQATLWDRVGKIAAISDRQQYLQCRLPKILPTVPQLLRAEEKESRTTLEAFRSPESLFLLELWKWLGPHRDRSVLSKCSAAAWAQMNLIFVEGDKWLVFNLGLLDSWRKGDEGSSGSIDPRQFQKRFLRLMMTLMESRAANGTTTPVTTINPDVKPAEPAPTSPEDAASAPVEPAPVQKKDEPLVAKVPTESGRTKKIELFKGVDRDVLPEHEHEIKFDEAKADAQIEDDLESLELIADNFERAIQEGRRSEADTAPDAQSELTPKIEFTPVQRTLEEAVMVRVNELAEGGLLSAGEYRRFMSLSQAYKTLPNPYQEGQTLEAGMRIDPDTLILKDDKTDRAVKMPDKVSVIDKSMLNDTLKAFDVNYIREVMPKDVLGMVVNLQQAGIAVTGYQIEDAEDAISKFETHTVNLTPVQGKPSTIRFMIPKVGEDGTMLVGNVKCRMRKARRDMPIRKVGPSKVALTSYYAKVFVSRSEKQVNNYPDWLTNQIAAIGMSVEDDRVKNLMLANVFDSNAVTPRVYSIMAARFRSLQIMGYDFFFDYHSREKHFGADNVKMVERQGMALVGQSTVNQRFIAMDTAGYLYELNADELIQIGTFESILSLGEKYPLEMIELKIFSKLIPIGVLMAYKLGFMQLLKTLRATFRVVPVGERLHLNNNEFPIRFENETYVINRDNRTASMVLAGFAGFEGFTRNYSSHLFDQSDIYLNMLESADFGIRYLREFDLMTDMFVDPITREILEEMHEPTAFLGLLFRACELLQTDWSPDETDMAYMRVAGYERIPGMVYSELVKAVRTHKARGGIQNAKIDLHPYVVWQAVTQDSSVKLVEDSNPINNVKEKEEVTYGGDGGRSDRSMVGRTRVFHPNDVGVISEATKDSAQVAVTTYLTADPNLRNLRGVTSRYNPDRDGPTSALSSSAMCVPAADRED